MWTNYDIPQELKQFFLDEIMYCELSLYFYNTCIKT